MVKLPNRIHKHTRKVKWKATRCISQLSPSSFSTIYKSSTFSTEGKVFSNLKNKIENTPNRHIVKQKIKRYNQSEERITNISIRRNQNYTSKINPKVERVKQNKTNIKTTKQRKHFSNKQKILSNTHSKTQQKVIQRAGKSKYCFKQTASPLNFSEPWPTNASTKTPPQSLTNARKTHLFLWPKLGIWCTHTPKRDAQNND